MITRPRAALLAVLLLAGLLTGPATGSATATGRRIHEGTIGGADYKVVVPQRWNGTLVLYSHGYYPQDFAPDYAMLSTRKETEEWLLDHGYALAASQFKGTFGFATADALDDQIALLDWFDANVGRPRRTISDGMSMGAGIAILLAERNPHRFAGVLAQCGDLDQNGTWNSALDVTFAIKTLLELPGRPIELVLARDAKGSNANLDAAVQTALSTQDGPARLALAGALANVPAWASAHEPAPTELDKRLQAVAAWVGGAYAFGTGPVGRADLEGRAGGNPSWNVGIDYRRLLARSAQRDLVAAAYREAGLDLAADLNRLAAAPRIAPDPRALAWMYRNTLLRGSTPVPVLTLHNTGDGGAVVDQERWYANQVRRAGDPNRLRQLYSDRGGHCATSAAEEIVALRTLERRIDTGHWPDTNPDRLNAAAAGLGPDHQLVLDLFVFKDKAMPPSFVRFTPPTFLRPSK